MWGGPLAVRSSTELPLHQSAAWEHKGTVSVCREIRRKEGLCLSPPCHAGNPESLSLHKACHSWIWPFGGRIETGGAGARASGAGHLPCWAAERRVSEILCDCGYF